MTITCIAISETHTFENNIVAFLENLLTATRAPEIAEGPIIIEVPTLPRHQAPARTILARGPCRISVIRDIHSSYSDQTGVQNNLRHENEDPAHDRRHSPTRSGARIVLQWYLVGAPGCSALREKVQYNSQAVLQARDEIAYHLD